MIAALALFAQISVIATAPDTVATCEAFEVTVAVDAAGQVPPYVLPPSFGPFDVLRSSPTPIMKSSGGGMTSAEFRYVLTTERPGSYTLAPFEVRLGGMVGRSRPLTIVVRSAATSPRVPTVVARARVDTSLEVNFRALTLPETVYVGQQANYEVAVFLNETVRERLRRNPTFFPPDMQSMLAYDIPAAPGEPPRRRVGSRCFDALVYQRALFPLLPGRFVIPPAQLVYSLPLSASFFSREESHELRTDSTIIVALDPPLQGRPADYAGAVGDLTIAARLDTARARVGDPLVLTVRVTGTGNVKLFPRPALDIPWATLVDGQERVNVDTMARRIRGTKEFEWLLTPRVAGELDLPPIRYPYFNPERQRYEIASSSPRSVRVAPGALAAMDTATGDRVLPLRAVYRGPVSPPAHRQPVFWALLAIAPLPALGARWRRRPRRVVRQLPAVRLRVLARAGTRDACELRRAFAGAFAERLGLAAAVFTRPGAMSRALRRAGVPTEIAADAERFLRTLDEAAYSAGGTLPHDATRRALDLFEAADREALPRAELRIPPAVLSALLLAAAAVLGAAPVDDARADFERGREQYAQRHFVVARDYFLRAARAVPGAPDAWVNAGTAAWAAGDTVNAVVGWQRTLRLEPLAGDARLRLAEVQPLALGSIGYVAPISPSLVAWLALAFWCAAWGIDALRVHRRGRGGGRLAVTFGVFAAVLALVAIDLGDRLDGRQLRVVRQLAHLSAVPALGGENVATAATGEVARVVRRDGVWTRVALDNGREGWIASEQLRPLTSNATLAD